MKTKLTFPVCAPFVGAVFAIRPTNGTCTYTESSHPSRYAVTFGKALFLQLSNIQQLYSNISPVNDMLISQNASVVTAVALEVMKRFHGVRLRRHCVVMQVSWLFELGLNVATVCLAYATSASDGCLSSGCERLRSRLFIYCT